MEVTLEAKHKGKYSPAEGIMYNFILYLSFATCMTEIMQHAEFLIQNVIVSLY